MPCAPNPVPAPPVIDPSISIPALPPAPNPTPKACCQLVTLPPIPPIPPLPIPPAALAAAANVLNSKLSLMMTYIDALQLPCPKS